MRFIKIISTGILLLGLLLAITFISRLSALYYYEKSDERHDYLS